MKCIKCGEIKDASEFPPVIKTDIFLKTECKSCRHKKSQKINRASVVANKILHEAVKKKARICNNKINACAKIFCPKISKERVIKLQCPVCAKHFGVTVTKYNATFKYFGRPPKYCSRYCYYISITKEWQQNNSAYAKKIKSLLEHPPKAAGLK